MIDWAPDGVRCAGANCPGIGIVQTDSVPARVLFGDFCGLGGDVVIQHVVPWGSGDGIYLCEAHAELVPEAVAFLAEKAEA